MQDSENNTGEIQHGIPLADVLSFVRWKTGRPDAEAEQDLFEDLGCTGKKFTDLVEHFSMRFGADVSNYKWYFHTNEEDHSIGGMFYKPPYERVQRIPVTPLMLWEMANAGYWNIEYPEHEIPSSRVDYLINILLFIAGCLLLAYLARKW
ncbi:DUF1493 family protein [Flaviaesturariibacter flavus]|uniref:DUF1493 family protein n=1 Tax=Flaviaesturariibacter flavus TaxID=2502780 RepID=A0A4V6NB24_9BACT|nr:DUF1493 family protein [Flaviaesturariibacter flavus]TCJ17492.1 DUF1493 family protein [Flaviaesturariibacter flavus]